MKILSQLILITWLLAGCNTSQEDITESDSGNMAEDLIVIPKNSISELPVKPQQTFISNNVAGRGYIEVPPGSRAKVSPFYPGYVQDIDLLPGQEVKKGQVLFTLRNPDYLEMQQTWLETREQLRFLEQDYNRQKELADENISSVKNFTKAESDYQLMKARHDGLTERLKLMQVNLTNLGKGNMVNTIAVRAPIDGFVIEVSAVKGAFIDAKEPALSIVNTEHLHLDLQVFEKDVTGIREGQMISFRVPEAGESIYKGKVYLVGKEVHQKSRTVVVHGHIEGEERLIPGMYVDAEIEVSGDRVTALPFGLFDQNDEGMFLTQKVDEDEVNYYGRLVKVTPGMLNEEWIELEDSDLWEKEFIRW